MFDQIWQFLLLLGIPSLITGLGMSRILKRIARSDQERQEAETCRDQYNLLILRSVNANMTLGQVTAKALRDGHCNGEVSAALEEAASIRKEQEKFFNEQVSKNINR